MHFNTGEAFGDRSALAEVKIVEPRRVGTLLLIDFSTSA